MSLLILKYLLIIIIQIFKILMNNKIKITVTIKIKNKKL
jgi:hypothetical protein